MKSISVEESDIDLLACPLFFYSKGNYGVTISQSYLELHLLFLLVLLHQEIWKEQAPPQAKVRPQHFKICFFNDQFHCLSQRGL